MNLEELSKEYSSLGIYEKRATTPEYCELVFYSKETEDWNKVLAGSLGPPLKPAGAKPTRGDLNLTKAFGGVNNNQTLFKKEVDGKVAIAMFWPWQDTVHTTLKVALI